MTTVSAQLAEVFDAPRRQLEILRSEISTKFSEIETIKNADVPIEVARDRFRDYIDSKTTSTWFEMQVRGFWRARQDTPPSLFPVTNGESERADVDRVICDLLRDMLIQRFETVASQQIDPGLPLEERPKVINQLQAELDELERQEEALIVECGGAGLNIERRDNIRPEIYLEWVD